MRSLAASVGTLLQPSLSSHTREQQAQLFPTAFKLESAFERAITPAVTVSVGQEPHIEIKVILKVVCLVTEIRSRAIPTRCYICSHTRRICIVCGPEETLLQCGEIERTGQPGDRHDFVAHLAPTPAASSPPHILS
eukprot:g30582.t1